MTASACNGAAEVARPDQPTATQAVGEPEQACTPEHLPAESAPLVVDWSDEQRAALEASMARGVAVVRYGCEGVEVLRACHLPGEYGYSAVSLKERTIQMEDGAALRANFSANLPFIKGVEAELAAGRTLQLATLLRGVRATTLAQASHDQLEGRCEGATHFVYDVSVGAFAMDTLARGEGSAGVDLLGKGGSASGVSSKAVAQRDGDPEACRATRPAGEVSPVSGCGAPLRVSLFALDAAKPTGEPDGTRRDARTCPEGFVWSEAQCVARAQAESFLCEAGELSQCEAQCERGSEASCGRMAQVQIGRITAGGAGVREALDALEGRGARLDAACELGEGAACTAMAYVRFRNLTGKAKKDNQIKGMDYAERGCVAGDAAGCALVRRAYLTESGRMVGVKLDAAHFAEILQRGCARGSALPCQHLAEAYLLGEGVSEDREAARAMARRACLGDQAAACMLEGALEGDGAACQRWMTRYVEAAPEDASAPTRQRLPQTCAPAQQARPEAGEALRRACRLGVEEACQES